MTEFSDRELLLASQAAKEVAAVVALALMTSEGDAGEAVERLAAASARVGADDHHLDCAGLGVQAIRYAEEIMERGG